jgi:hypothetical protein
MVKSRSKISRQPVKKSPARAAGKSARKSTAAKTATKGKWVYAFGDGRAEARATMRNLLGGKGASRKHNSDVRLRSPRAFALASAGRSREPAGLCPASWEQGEAVSFADWQASNEPQNWLRPRGPGISVPSSPGVRGHAGICKVDGGAMCGFHNSSFDPQTLVLLEASAKMRQSGLRRISPNCRGCCARLDTRNALQWLVVVLGDRRTPQCSRCNFGFSGQSWAHS